MHRSIAVSTFLLFPVACAGADRAPTDEERIAPLVAAQGCWGGVIKFVVIRGAGPALQDLVAGQIDILFDQPSNSLSQVRAGKAQAFAVAASTRLAAAPEIPTTDEAGLPGLYNLSWNAVWAPKGRPKAIVAKLNAAVMAALSEPA